jgi:hypothetical protein
MFIASQFLRILELRRSDMSDSSGKDILNTREKHATPTEFLESIAVRFYKHFTPSEFKACA